MSEGGALALCGAGVGVSMFYQIRKGDDPIPVMVIGGIFTGVCVGITALNPEIGMALAGVFFLGMFLSRGTELIDWTSGVVNGSKTSKMKTKPKAGTK